MRAIPKHLLSLIASVALLGGAAVAEDAPISLLPNTPASANDADASAAKPVTAITARIGQHDDFDRIVFDWPRATTYKVSREGERVTVRFNAPAIIKLGAAARLTRARDFKTGTGSNGNATVSFTVSSPVTVKDFTNGNSIAFDFQGNRATVATAASEPPQAPEPATPAVAETPAPPKEPMTPVMADKTPTPPAATTTPAPQTVTTKIEAPATLPTALPEPTASVPKAVTETPQAAAPAMTTTVADPPTTTVDAANLANSLSPTPILVGTLDPGTSMRAVIWQRGGFGYIMFDRKLTLALDSLTKNAAAPLVNFQPLDLPKNTAYRFALPGGSALHATASASAWKLFLSSKQPDVPVSTSLIAQPDFALGARMLLPLPDAPEPVHLTDPVVGDEIVVVPLAQNQSLSLPRRMTDFQIWPAAQGMVLKPTNDRLIVRAVADGIEVTADGGLHLSNAIDTGAAQQSATRARAAAAGKSLFDFATWRGKPDETFVQGRRRLQQTIVDVPERERNRARLELARFYFARGMGEEALALLNMLAKDTPDLKSHAEFLTLSGAAKITAYRAEDGLKDMEAANIHDQPEVKLWQAVGNAELRNWVEAEDKFAAAEALMEGYPEPYFSRFFILAVESALAIGNMREAAEWLEKVETAPHQPGIEPAINYLHGVMHAQSGRAAAAAQSWKDAAASNDRLYKIRAELALVDLGVANGSLTPTQAAERLEAMRFGWRGDDLEADILHRLGQFYIQAKNVKSGLATLAQTVRLYPRSPQISKIREEMSQTFRDVFLGDKGKTFSPLESLTIYQQYRDTLMPTGTDGIAVTRNLAERLAAVDLMQQAGDLLEDIAKNKVQGEEKARVGARLAALRLIDHKPEAALDALDIGANEALPTPLQHERLLLRAKALSELKRADEALAIIRDDTRLPAKLLRADITMRAQKWDEAAKAWMDVVGQPPKAGVNLRADQADWLVRAAMAMAMAGDQAGLDHLAIDYGAAMAGSAQNDTFRVLTQPDSPGQLKDITAAQARIAEVDMFQSFLDSYRKSEKPDVPGETKKP